MLTGQKIPATGVLADILQGIQQLQFQVSQVLTQQQQLYARLENLESNASSQLTNLSQQLNNNFRLIAQETKRSLELSSQPKELAPE
jgi:TolA-binding protein